MSAPFVGLELKLNEDHSLLQKYQCKDDLPPPENSSESIFFLLGKEDATVYAQHSLSSGIHTYFQSNRKN